MEGAAPADDWFPGKKAPAVQKPGLSGTKFASVGTWSSQRSRPRLGWGTLAESDRQLGNIDRKTPSQAGGAGDPGRICV